MKRKPKRKVTIRDVADLIDVHHSTVSRALSPTKREQISPGMVERVENAAEELGYYPNIVASSLKQSRSFAIGVLIPDLMNPLFPPIIRGIQDVAEAFGFTVITANTDDQEVKERDALRSMQGRSIEGVIIATTRRVDPVDEECIGNDIPFVLVNRTVDRDGVNAVIIDEDFGIRTVLDQMLDMNHTHIAHVAGPQNTLTGYDRAKSVSDYLDSHSLRSDLVETTNRFTVEEGRRAFKSLIARDSDFTPVVAGNDLLALGCMDAMAEIGLSVPDDMSICGYDDILFLERMSPALTTVLLPKYEMGVHAATTLPDIIGDVSDGPGILRMQPKLVVRDSTAVAQPC